MSYPTLLVHLDGDARCHARVALALRIAAQRHAHLIGLAPTGSLDLPVPVEADLRGWPDIVEAGRHQYHARAQALVDAFSAQARAHGLKSFAGVVDEDDAEAAVLARGRLADLLVLSPHGPGGSVRHDFLHRVFMQVGRPVLVVPCERPVETVATRVLVAWNGSRESARALADALPLLRTARGVCVLALDRADEALVSRLELNDVRHWLQRHGVQAQCVQHSAEGDLGEALLLRAAQMQADLIVIGGYGHARLAELALGGMTRSVLRHAVVPVLVSH